MHRWEYKALAHLSLDEESCTLVPTITVFLVDGRMMLVGVLAAFLHHGNEGPELGPSIPGVVYVGWSLKRLAGGWQRVQKKHTQSPF